MTLYLAVAYLYETRTRKPLIAIIKRQRKPYANSAGGFGPGSSIGGGGMSKWACEFRKACMDPKGRS